MFSECQLNHIPLKVGAQVMLIQVMKQKCIRAFSQDNSFQNVVQGSMVNGSCGKVIDFMTHHEALEKHITIDRISSGERRNRDVTEDPLLPPEPVSITNSQFMPHDKWPLVQFSTGGLLLCAPLEFTVEGFMGNVEAQRVQVPLILSWALSIHKSQGQTLERVKIDLSKIFEKGQGKLHFFTHISWLTQLLSVCRHFTRHQAGTN
jgi:ATP-dependent DNA helicase PIF1